MLNPSRASNGSQFYVVLRPEPDLDKDYTVFGQVTGGLEFLDSVSRRGRDTNDYPLERVDDQADRDPGLIRRVETKISSSRRLPRKQDSPIGSSPLPLPGRRCPRHFRLDRDFAGDG